ISALYSSGICLYILRLYHDKNLRRNFCLPSEGTNSLILLKNTASCLYIRLSDKRPVIDPISNGLPSTYNSQRPCLFLIKKLLPAKKVESFRVCFSGKSLLYFEMSGRLVTDFLIPQEYIKPAKIASKNTFLCHCKSPISIGAVILFINAFYHFLFFIIHPLLSDSSAHKVFEGSHKHNIGHKLCEL